MAVDATEAVKLASIDVSAIFDETEWAVIIKETVYVVMRSTTVIP